MTQPKAFGGLGLAPRQAWEAVLEIGRGCSSCAWIVGLRASNVLLLGKFSDQAQRDVFLSGKPTILSLLTGGVGHDIAVERCSGGLMLSGNWRYASGIDVAWAGLLITVPGVGSDAAEQYVVLVSKDAFEIDHASWHVLGMRGTGSKNISLRSTLVPEHRWMSWKAVQAGRKHADCPNTDAVSDYPLNAALAMSVAAPTLGVASAVAEEFRETVKRRINSGTQQHQVEDKIAQIEVACGEATTCSPSSRSRTSSSKLRIPRGRSSESRRLRGQASSSRSRPSHTRKTVASESTSARKWGSTSGRPVESGAPRWSEGKHGILLPVAALDLLHARLPTCRLLPRLGTACERERHHRNLLCFRRTRSRGNHPVWLARRHWRAKGSFVAVFSLARSPKHEGLVGFSRVPSRMRRLPPGCAISLAPRSRSAPRRAG